ncbi:MAG: energy-coupling factor transporter transmembrane protein EcfT [Bacteroidetes bacterium]|nr:energy-coupling factor transporter transmembrane protein EcfT [Bacteroidota bacterium]
MPTPDSFTRNYNPFYHYLVLSIVLAAFGFRLEWQLPVLSVLMVVAAFSPDRKQIYRGFLKFVLPLILIGFFVNGMFFTGNVVFALGPLKFKGDGLLFASRVAVRLMLIVISIGFFFSKVKAETISEYLVSEGVDRRFVYIYLLSVAMVHLMRDKLQKIYIAQSARGLDTTKNLFARAKYLLPLLVPLSYSYIAESLDRGIALQATNFTGKKDVLHGQTTALLKIEVNRTGLIIGRILLVATLGITLWRLFA